VSDLYENDVAYLPSPEAQEAAYWEARRQHMGLTDKQVGDLLRAAAPHMPVRATPPPDDLRALVEQGIEALRLTREYVGEDVLPATPGWSWFDWTERAREALRAATPESPYHLPDCPFWEGEGIDCTCPACPVPGPEEDSSGD
jgi:hypothetical protein